MTLFETAIGRCGIAFSDTAILAVTFPEPTPAATLARLRRILGDAPQAPPPAHAENAIAAITRLLAGEPEDLAGIPLDLGEIADFDRRVLERAREVGPGETITYGELARRIGSPSEAREVGAALGRNRFPIIVPCHRVVAANGKLGGFSARGGTKTKQRLLEIESRHGAPMTLFGVAQTHIA